MRGRSPTMLICDVLVVTPKVRALARSLFGWMAITQHVVGCAVAASVGLLSLIGEITIANIPMKGMSHIH